MIIIVSTQNKETVRRDNTRELRLKQNLKLKVEKKYFKIDRHRFTSSSNRNNSSSSSSHSFQTLPEYTANLNSDTDILDSSSSNHSPSAPYSPDRAIVTPNNTPIIQTSNNNSTTNYYNNHNLFHKT